LDTEVRALTSQISTNVLKVTKRLFNKVQN
jgi:hypothetical protein